MTAWEKTSDCFGCDNTVDSNRIRWGMRESGDDWSILIRELKFKGLLKIQQRSWDICETKTCPLSCVVL